MEWCECPGKRPRTGSGKLCTKHQRLSRKVGEALEEAPWSLKGPVPCSGSGCTTGGAGGTHGLQREALRGCLQQEQEERPLTAWSQWHHLPPPPITPFHAPHTVRLPETTVCWRTCPPEPRWEGSLPLEGRGAGVLSIPLCPASWPPPAAYWASESHPFYSQDFYTLIPCFIWATSCLYLSS